MTVVNVSKSPEHDASQASDEKAFADKLVEQFDLPASLTKAIEEAEVPKEVEEPEVEEEAKPEVAEEEATEEKVEPEAEEDEELIPKSKFQKRLDEITREKRLLEVRLRALEEKATQAPQTVDEDTAKLQKMSESELQTLKRQVRVSQAKSAGDEAMLNKLLDLEEKIDNVARTAPQRFEQNQVSKFNEAVQMTAPEIPNFDKAQKDIFALAKNIYDNAPELHRAEMGQARAWNLAVEHYKVLSKAQAGKANVADAERRMNTLKKKVSVDGAVRKVAASKDDGNKLYEKAKNGTFHDKLSFVRKALDTDAEIDGFMKGRN